MVMSIIAEEVYQSIRSKVVICCTKGNVSSDMQNMQYMYFGQKVTYHLLLKVVMICS